MEKILLSLFIILLGLSPLTSQASEASSTKLNVMESLATSTEEETKELALEGLKELIENGLAEEDLSRAMDILTLLANEGVTNISYKGHKKNTAYPSIREGAAVILGSTGDSRVLSPLLAIIFYDENVQVIKAAVQSTSQLAPDSVDKLAVAYARILKNTRLVYNNEELIQFTLEAVSITGGKDEILFDNQDLIDGLDFVSQPFSGYGRNTRNRAVEVLEQALMPKG